MKRLFQMCLCRATAILIGLTGATGTAGAAGLLPDVGFPVGESLTYDMHYGLLHVGTTEVTTEWINEDGKPLVAIRFSTRTNKFFDKIYRVEDVVESVIDPVTFRPLRFHKKLQEGDFNSEELTVFDYAAGYARWTNIATGASREYQIDADTRDIIAFMYRMRGVTLERGKIGDYWVAGDEGMCRLRLRGGATRTVDVGVFGEVKAMRVVPEVADDQLFVRKLPRELWVSRDDRRLIVQMSVKVPVAHVVLTLRNVGGPGDDFWTRKSRKNDAPVLAHED
jgi:hypothetical protein